MARETWTDERLGDLAAKVDKGFAEARVEVRDLRAEMDKGFAGSKVEVRDLRAEMGKGFERVDKKFERVDKKFDALEEKFDRKFDSQQRNMTTWFIAIFSTNVTLAAAVIAAAALG